MIQNLIQPDKYGKAGKKITGKLPGGAESLLQFVPAIHLHVWRNTPE
jgi:hypothetical protein